MLSCRWTLLFMFILILATLVGLAGCKDEKEDETKTTEEAAEDKPSPEEMAPKCLELNENAGDRFCCEPGQTLKGGLPPKHESLWCETDDVKQGSARDFHPEGLLHWNTTYNKGQEHGTRIAWHKNRVKHYEMNFQDGRKHGPMTEWSAAGQLHCEGAYEKGDKHGPEIVYHKNGSKKSMGTYLHGKRDGLWTEWRKSGQKKSKVEYDRGFRHGTEVFWHTNGQMWYREVYENGTRIGQREEWTPEGAALSGPGVK